MIDDPDKTKLVTELLGMLEPRFPGIGITISHSERWNRPCATFVWSGFGALLPEERFQRLTQVIPESMRARRMSDMAWLELAPNEDLDTFLSMPRSEDIGPRERDIYRKLHKGGFFDLLARSLGGAAERNCSGDFSKTLEALSRSKGLSVSPEDAKLVFIRHGVYCDCQILKSAQPALAELYAGAA